MNCKYLADGKCQKYKIADPMCGDTDGSCFMDTFQKIGMAEVCGEMSLCWNMLYTVTREQLEHLMNGGVLFDVNDMDYGIFIRLED